VGGLTRLVLRRRWLVVAAWTLVVVVSALASSRLSDLLTNRFTLPGTDTRRAEVILEEHFGQSTDGTFTVVVQTDGPAAASLPRVRKAAARGAAAARTGQLAAVEALAEDVVSATIVTKLDPAEAKGYTDDIRAAVGTIPGATVRGLTKTGRLVTAAGLIMFAAFMGFVAGSVVGLQQFGFGLAGAILIDVTIVRARSSSRAR
jgi:uncharacterized membrane protein YdfJ with MMPL/SSD domain